MQVLLSVPVLAVGEGLVSSRQNQVLIPMSGRANLHAVGIRLTMPRAYLFSPGDRKGEGRPYGGTGGFCVGAAACPRPEETDL